MGEIEHAGTPKTMPAITEDEHAGTPQTMPAITEDEHAGTPPTMPAIADDKAAIRTSDDGAEVAGEIVAEPTDKTASPAGADKVAAERGMPPLRKRTELGTPAFRKR